MMMGMNEITEMNRRLKALENTVNSMLSEIIMIKATIIKLEVEEDDQEESEESDFEEDLESGEEVVLDGPQKILVTGPFSFSSLGNDLYIEMYENSSMTLNY